MFKFQESQVQSGMLLVKYCFQIRICVDYIDEHLCVIESGPIMSFNTNRLWKSVLES
jgi:hypothetical protein